ncbi:hypothetical protein AGMMS50212_13560 [Spirochaetia bacterium]|nr:hypothetical protein AGMMS50212_13560 [Spirochaetia bacterium]
MNNEEIKNLLLTIEDAPQEFSVVLSGKKSAKVNGLYKTDTREIIIHNKNFLQDGSTNQNLLIYTAIHEYAHHLHACKRGGKLSSRSHTTEFWAIFHNLLEKAEKLKLYKNTISESPELLKLTERIREKFLTENGKLVKELGNELKNAFDICKDIGVRFEDYIDRVLCIPRLAARTAMKISQYDFPPELGSDNMRFLAGISNDDDRKMSERALLAGKSPDTVKMNLREGKTAEEDTKVSLEKEKARLERTIDTLNKRLDEIMRELDSID